MTGLKHTLRSRRGFTLVELIVVLVILGVLAAFAVPALTGYIDSAHEKQAVSEAQACVETVTRIAAQKYAKWLKATTEKSFGSSLADNDSSLAPLASWAGAVSDAPPAVSGGTVALTEGRGQYLLHVNSYEYGGFPATGDTTSITQQAGVTGNIRTLTCSASGQVVYLVYESQSGIRVVYTNTASQTTVDTPDEVVVVPTPKVTDGSGDNSGGDNGGNNGGSNGGETPGGDSGSTEPPTLPEGALGFATFYYYDVDGKTPLKGVSVNLYYKYDEVLIGNFTTNAAGAIYVPVFPSPQDESQRRTDRVEGYNNNFYRLRPTTPEGRQEMLYTDFQVGQDAAPVPTAFTLYAPTDQNSYRYKDGLLDQANNSYTIYNPAVPTMKLRVVDESGRDVNNVQLTLHRGTTANGETQVSYTTLGAAKEIAIRQHEGDNIPASQSTIWTGDCFIEFTYSKTAYEGLNDFPINISFWNGFTVESHWSNGTAWSWDADTTTLTLTCKALSQPDATPTATPTATPVPTANLTIEFVDADTGRAVTNGSYELRPYNIYYPAQASFANRTGTNTLTVSPAAGTGTLLTHQYYLLVQTAGPSGYDAIPTIGFTVGAQADGVPSRFTTTTGSDGVTFDPDTLTITVQLTKTQTPPQPTATPTATPKPTATPNPDSFNGIVEIKAYVDGDTTAPTFKLYNYNEDGSYKDFTNLKDSTYSGTYPYTFTTPLYLGDKEDKSTPMIELGKTYLLAENKMPGTRKYLEQAAYLFRYVKDANGNIIMQYKRPSEPDTDWKTSDTLTLSFANVQTLPVSGTKYDANINLMQGGKAAIWPADNQYYLGGNRAITGALATGNMYEYQGIYYICTKLPKEEYTLKATDQPMNFAPSDGRDIEMLPLSTADVYAKNNPKSGYTVGDMYYAESAATGKKYLYICRQATATTPSDKGDEYWYLWSDGLANATSFVTVTAK